MYVHALRFELPEPEKQKYLSIINKLSAESRWYKADFAADTTKECVTAQDKAEHIQLAEFPLSCLPEVLKRFVRELSANVQVSPDMCVLPLLSVLSVVMQGKAVILNPGGGNTETLNLYTLTVAEPGERKSGVFRALTAPLYSFQKEENERREPLIREYQFKKAAVLK